MKIGFDAKRIFHNFRGLGNYSRTLLEGICHFYPEQKNVLYTPSYHDQRAIEWEKKHSQCQIQTPSNLFFKSCPSLWRSFYLSRLFDKDNLDIYHGLTNELPYETKKTSCKLIVTIHDLIFLRFPHLFPWIDRRIYLKKVLYACQKAHIIIAICEQTKRDIVDFLNISPTKIEIVYQSVHPRFLEAPPQKNISFFLSQHRINSPYILFVGAIEERKNVLGLIQAYQKIEKNIEEDLILVGQGGSYQQKVLHFIRKHRLEKRVRVLSNILSDDLPLIYRGCTLFCYPSLFEGFGLPIVEASYCERPVITSTGSCFAEAGGNGPCYIKPNNIEALSEALKHVLGNSAKRSEMALSGYQYVQKHFNLEKTTHRLMKVYTL